MTKGRICEVCGRRLYKRKWVAYEFPIALEELEFRGTWAHPNCIIRLQKYRDALRKLTLKESND